MKIKRTNEIFEQVLLAKQVKLEALRLIRKKIHMAESKGLNVEHWNSLLREVDLSTESFEILVKTFDSKEVNRCISMFTGPLFTSSDFPMPVTESGPMFPILQLELKPLSEAIKDDLGDGLLQLWFDIVEKKELIRVIPVADVKSQNLTNFNWLPLASDDTFPLPAYWNLNPFGQKIEVITGLKSKGIETHQGNMEASYFLASEDAECWLWTLLQVFEKITPYKSTRSLELFGKHRVIQYSASEVNMNRLIEFSDWGSCGHAQIFYKTYKGRPTEFSFWNCMR